MQSKDKRKSYILGIALSILGADSSGGIASQILDSPQVAAFLDDPSTSLLQIICEGSTCKITNEFESPPPNAPEAHFLKTSPQAITETNMQEQIIVSSTPQNPIAVLIQSLNNVYLPSAKDSSELSLQLKELSAALGKALNKTRATKINDPSDLDDFKEILTLSDEASFWQELSTVSGGKGLNLSKTKDDVKTVAEIISKISKSFKEAEALEITRVSEVLEHAGDALDQIWRDFEMYSAERMKHLFKLISDSIQKRIQDEFKASDLWTGQFSDIRIKLNECLKTSVAWLKQTADLTQRFWTGAGASRKWTGGKYADNGLLQLKKRLNEIFLLRSQHDELLRLLSPEDQKRLNVEGTFKPFRNINVLHCSSKYSQEEWEDAQKQYFKNVQPIEGEIITKLRKEIFAEKLNATQLLREFRRWRGLLDLANIKNAFSAERESLLVSLIQEAKQLKEEFETRSGQRMDAVPGMDKPPESRYSSKHVSAILWTRQLFGKLQSNFKMAQSLLSDLKDSGTYVKLAQDMTNAMKGYETEQYCAWAEEIKQQMETEDSQLALNMAGKFMDINIKKGGIVEVNYSERLAVLIREVRQLKELEFKIPKEIDKLAEDAKKFYRQAVTLKQIADFYNNMQTQMVWSQRPMMLKLAIEFEGTLKSSELSEGTTWSNTVELERYISRVRAAAEVLMNENRRLKRIHDMVGDLVAELLSTDLIKNRQRWKDTMEKIRYAVEGVCKGRDRAEVEGWLLHWDYQLYKVLQYHYVTGLHSLSEILPNFTVEIAYSNKQITFNPPLEDLKLKYYREIKSFIGIPANFTGVGGSTGIFKAMIDSNASSLNIIYSKAEELFDKLNKLLKSLEGWTVIGMIDAESFIEKNLKTAEHWSENFKTMLGKRRELEKMQDTYKIDCFNVSISPFKQSIEDLLQRYIDILVRTLKTSIKGEKENLEAFLTKAMTKLTAKPQTVAEINEARTAALEINQQKSEFVKSFTECQERNKLLRQIGGQNVNISHLESQWHNLETALNEYSETIEKQKSLVKAEIDNRISMLNQDIDKFYARWSALKPKEKDDLDQQSASEMAKKMKEWKEEWDTLEKRVVTVKGDAEHFQMPAPRLSKYQDVVNELVEQEKAWQLHDEYEKELSAMTKEDWLSFRAKIFTFQDLLNNWTEKIKGKERNVVTNYLRNELERFKQAWPLLKAIVGEAFEKEHWKTLFVFLKLDKAITIENVTFGNLISAVPALIEKANDIKELCARAQGEVSIREAIHELRVWCETVEFNLLEYTQNNRTTPLIKEWKEIMTQVSDHQALLMNLKESRYFSRFEDQIGQFESKLSGVDEYLQKLNVIQRKWVYLEPILGRGALPQEQGRFKRVDEEYRSIMLNIGSNPKVLNLCSIPGLKDSLEMILEQLDRCQKALNDFLEEKRAKFSRFYFIGDDDLLEILGQSKNPLVIQTHLKKLFAGIHTVEFNKDITSIIAMKSSLGEYVPLTTTINIQGEVETWLNDLANGMKQTLQKMLNKAVSEAQLDIVNNPSQISCLSELVNFTEMTYKCIASNKLGPYKQELTKKLESYIAYNAVDNMLLQNKIKALVLDIIHNIDVLDQLIKNQVTAPNAWQWFKQLKFRMQEEICNIYMCSANFLYTYEYQGNAQKLVHTPLTDKCYLTLTQGMKMGYGGNPYGPAGTGKTESVKALGQAFGRQVLVFNCDEGIDFQSMGRIFVGLIKCGAWGCFDEFNRLLEEQLSAISQQIQVIQWALKENSPKLTLLGKSVDVNRNSGIFVTMNPAGKGYGGRSKLPDNLKQLFRPVAMSVPDNDLIAEILLFAEGFKSAKELSQKVVSLFSLCKQLLSYQQHYDWGLRALKTVLTVGGNLIQENKKQKKTIDDKIEAALLIKAIRINTLSKLTFADSNKFLGLLGDMFPGISSEDIAYENVQEAIKTACGELKLEFIPALTKKMLELHEALRQRMGVVLVGPSGCGKSTIWKVLKSAYEKMGQKVVTHVMNPKAMDKKLLLGNMDHDTREWTDGVLTASARHVVKEPGEVKCWIICDGDIDPEWVESLNSVLDDNHLLTLPNGERINFGTNVNFLFETDNLRYASPATVSRMGVIYMCDEDIDVQRLVNTWLRKQDDNSRAKLGSWVENFFGRAMDWVIGQHFEDMVVATTRVGIVSNVLSLTSGAKTKPEFALGLVWGFGSNLPIQLRNEFAKEFLAVMGEKPVDLKNPLNMRYDDKGECYRGYNFNKTDLFNADTGINVENPPMVHTIGAQRDSQLINKWIETNEPFILVGPEGCGKNLLLNSVFSKLKSTHVATIHCDAETTASHLMQKLKQMCTQSGSSQGKVYRPKDALKLIIVLKDINLPRPNQYETIQLIAFLQQILSYNGFYDEDLEFVYLERVQIIASMNPASTIGRHVLSSRFTAVVRILYIDYPTDEELVQIYTEYFTHILAIPNLSKAGLAPQAKKMAQFVVEVLKHVKNRFSIDDHRHYMFTPREVTQWCFSLARYTAETKEDLAAIIVWEANRVFRDRLVGRESVIAFDQIIAGQLKGILGIDANPKLMADIYFGASKEKTGKITTMERYAKTDFVNLVSQAIKSYEREYKEIKLHLIDEVLELISAEDRIVSTVGGAVLIAGISGVGRRTCTQLVAYMRGLEFVSPKIGREYTIKEFSKDLKTLFAQLVQENRQALLFIEDHQLTDPKFMQYLNSLISSWEIPGLYTSEELEQLFASLQDEFKTQYAHRHIFEYFKAKIKNNLRIVLSLDYTHPSFMSYCASNPALYSKCGIIWREQWSKNSMMSLCAHELDDILGKSDAKKDIYNNTILLHNICVKLGATPLKYFHLLSNYRKIYGLKINSQGDQSKRLSSGLNKLSEAEQMVAKLVNEVTNSKNELSRKQVEAKNAMEDIEKAMVIASDRKSEVEKLQKVLKVEEEKIKKKKIDIDEELRDIMPAVEKAQKEVGSLREDNIREIKTFKIPSDAVYDVLSCVLMLMGIYNTSWNSMKIFLGQSGVIKQIVSYDARSITPKMRSDLVKFLNEKSNSFDHDTIYRASVACAPLAAWVIAMVKFSEALEKVKPLEDEKKTMESELVTSQDKLKKCEEELAKLSEQVVKLKTRFETCTKEAAKLEASLKIAEDKLESAQSLIGKLSGEKGRWATRQKSIETEVALVPNTGLLAAAFITYLGGANESRRAETMAEWKNVVKVGNFKFTHFMCNESELLKWKSEGLPADDLSIENAIILLNSTKTPLIIDPSTQATEWLKHHLKETGSQVDILNQQDPKFVTQLELAIRFGKTLIVQENDTLEGMMFPILRKDLLHQGPRWVVNIGEKQIDYTESFTVFLCTRDPYVEIPPNGLSQIAVVNFTVTKSGLEGQLLGITLNFEKPELEQQKNELLEKEERLKIQLADLEDKLLTQLVSSGKENILENKALVESLNETKAKSMTIEESIRQSRELQDNLDIQRAAYKPFAEIGSTLFMVISDLQKLNNMYQFSLMSFIKLFKKALDSKPDVDNVEKKLAILSQTLVKLTFYNMGRSLLKADRLMFGLYFVKGVYPQLIAENEWEFFIGTVVAGEDQSGVNFPKWASQDRKEIFTTFASTFPKLVSCTSLENESVWKNWANSVQCEKEFPTQVKTKLSSFERLLFVQVFRPDRLESAMAQFVCEALNERNVSPPPMPLQRIYEEESSCTEPILFITGPGSDPSKELQEFAEQQVGRDKYFELAMGGGQNDVAMKMMREAAKEGNWVCLKNLHLVTSWLPLLEKELKILKPHKNFRIWLTTEPHHKFPAILLQSSLKIAHEAPPGIKKNLQRTFQAFASSLPSGVNPEYMQMLFSLAWLHAIIQERRTYIPQGWTKFYEFSYGDLRAAEGILKELLDGAKGGKMPFETAYGLLENAVYGGRIDNEFDIKIFRCYLKSIFNSEVMSGTKKLSNIIQIPTTTELKDIIALISKLPDTDSPEIFGLPSNIDRSVQRFNSQKILVSLKQLQSISAEDLKFNREKWMAQLGPLLKLWKTLVKIDEFRKYKITATQMSSANPIEGFIYMEFYNMQQLMERIHETLEGIGNVLYSSGLLTSSIEKDAMTLLKSIFFMSYD